MNIAGTTSNLLVNGGAEQSARNFPYYGWVKLNGKCEWGAFTEYGDVKPRSGNYFFAPTDKNDGNSLKKMINQILTAPIFNINNLPGLIPGGFTPGNMPPGYTPGAVPVGMPSIPGLPSMQDLLGKIGLSSVPGMPQKPGAPGVNLPGISGIPGIPTNLPGMGGFSLPGIPSIPSITDIASAIVYWAVNTGEAETTLVQEIDVSLFKNYIDAGVQTFSFSGWHRSNGGGHKSEIAIAFYDRPINLKDQTEISKRFKSGNEIPLKYYTSGEYKDKTWKQFSVNDAIPKNTRKVYVFIRAWRSFNLMNTYYAGYFDDLSFTMPVYKLPFSISGNSVAVGSTVKITPGIAMSDITYQSLNPDIASVDASGTVKGIKVGTAKIRVIDPVFKNAANEISINVVQAQSNSLSGSGTSGNPYIISSAEQLVWLAQEIKAGKTAYNEKYYKTAIGSMVTPPPTPTPAPAPAPVDEIAYNPANLRITDEGALGWLLTDGSSRMKMFDNQEDAQNGLRIARLHNRQGFVGRNNKRTNRIDYILEYWTGNSGLPKEALSKVDRISYNPSNITIVDMQVQGWSIRDGDHYLFIADNKNDAEAIANIVRQFKSVCYIGRDNKRSNRKDYIMTYFE